jgi:hypothetical protein
MAWPGGSRLNWVSKSCAPTARGWAILVGTQHSAVAHRYRRLAFNPHLERGLADGRHAKR